MAAINRSIATGIADDASGRRGEIDRSMDSQLDADHDAHHAGHQKNKHATPRWVAAWRAVTAEMM